MAGRTLNLIAGLMVAVVLIAIPVGYAHFRNTHSRNIRVVEPGVLYRSGQLAQAGLKRLIHDYGIRTVITLRDSDDPSLAPPDHAEEEFCKKHNIKYVRITPKSWWPEYDGPPPAQKGVATFLQAMDDRQNYPVLLHCFAGTHRTGAMVAIFRMEFNRWTNSEALAELRNAGYDNLDNELDVLTYLDKYEARWKK